MDADRTREPHPQPAPAGATTATAATTETATVPHRPGFRLHRSRSDRMVGGVCGGLAEGLDLDPALVRIAVFTLTVLSGGGAALVYLAAWILVPAA